MPDFVPTLNLSRFFHRDPNVVIIHVQVAHGGAEVRMTRAEYLELKHHLAKMRGYNVPKVG